VNPCALGIPAEFTIMGPWMFILQRDLYCFSWKTT